MARVSCGKELNSYIGAVFNRLTVISYYGKWKDGSHAFNCLCECGKNTVVIKSNLVRGNTKSCGCYCKERGIEVRKKHGRCRTPEYIAWAGIKARCNNPKEAAYKYYGGRGIQVSKDWNDSFESFFRDIGERPSDEHTVERENVNGNYCKENCFWATMKVQGNNRTNTIHFYHNGSKLTVTDFCFMYGVNRKAFYSRYYRTGLETATNYYSSRYTGTSLKNN